MVAGGATQVGEEYEKRLTGSKCQPSGSIVGGSAWGTLRCAPQQEQAQKGEQAWSSSWSREDSIGAVSSPVDFV